MDSSVQPHGHVSERRSFKAEGPRRCRECHMVMCWDIPPATRHPCTLLVDHNGAHANQWSGQTWARLTAPAEKAAREKAKWATAAASPSTAP